MGNSSLGDLMGAEVLTESYQGSIIGNAASAPGTGLVFGMYTVDCTENDDWVILGDFTAIKGIICQKVDTGAYTTEAVTVPEGTTNMVKFTAGSTNTMHMMVWGTPP